MCGLPTSVLSAKAAAAGPHSRQIQNWEPDTSVHHIMSYQRGEGFSHHEVQNRGVCPGSDEQDSFPPPRAPWHYTSRDLSSVPPKPPSTCSSTYSEEEPCRPAPNHPFAGHGSLTLPPDQSPAESFEGFLNEDSMAMIRPLGINIVANLHPDRPHVTVCQEIHSPQPKYPDHKLVQSWESHKHFEVSPIISPPHKRTLPFQTYEVSPLPLESVLARESAPRGSERKLDTAYQQATGGAGCISRFPSSWEGLALAALRLPLEPRPPFSVEEAWPRCSEPPAGSLIETASSPRNGAFVSVAAFQSAPLAPSRKYTSLQPRSEMVRVVGPSTPAYDHMAIGACNMTAHPSTDPLKGPGDYYTNRMKPGCSGCDRSHNGSAAAAEGVGKSTGVGKLVSRFKHTGGDVMSKFSLAWEESKREKRIEELKMKIQHQCNHQHVEEDALLR